MADVFAVFGILLSLGIVFPGMLSALWLLLPGAVGRAQLRLERTPWRCFWLGGIATALAAIPITVLLALPMAPAKLLGWVAIVALLSVSCLGAAGLAARMSRVMRPDVAAGSMAVGDFVRAAVALELAAVFPVVGWFVFIPLAVVTSLGATVFALLGWLPRRVPAPAPVVSPLGQH